MSANFRSDNEAPVAPQIWEALEKANKGTAHAYGEDAWSARLDAAFSDLFETQTRALPIATGTAANAIALATVTPPWGTVFCHTSAHISDDEGGAPEFFGNGLRLAPVPGENGKMNPEDFAVAINKAEGHGVHSYVRSALSLTQSTEMGSVYENDELQILNQMALDQGMSTHMDGARFANAVSALGCSPAEGSWKTGVQMLSFGASKNGCMSAEVLLFFGKPDRYEIAERHRKRGGHMLSKMRYVSAQLLAYIENDLWLNLAGDANRQAAIFSNAVESHPVAKLEFPSRANEVFVRWTNSDLMQLKSKGIQFQIWPGYDDLARFVFSYSTTDEQTQSLINSINSQ